MTPLARTIVRDVILNRRCDRRFRAYTQKIMEDTHYFDAAEVCHISYDLMKRLDEDDFQKMSDYIFLPAPKTWIEIVGSTRRIALHLEQSGPDILLKAIFRSELDGQLHFFPYGKVSADLKLILDEDIQTAVPQDERSSFANITKHVYVLLSMINTPKVFGRRQFMPQYALEKKLTRGLGVGKFPLHAWTEIKLEVMKPMEIDDGEPHEAHLTGKRALHFCRAHLRVRLGRLEYVASHWRGDPAIGIRQSRYVVGR